VGAGVKGHRVSQSRVTERLSRTELTAYSYNVENVLVLYSSYSDNYGYIYHNFVFFIRAVSVPIELLVESYSYSEYSGTVHSTDPSTGNPPQPTTHQ
jgi:hypothetical protein